MITPPPLLLVAAACADWLVTFRPLNAIAKMFNLELERLQESLTTVHPFTFRGKLESALAAPQIRPDLIPHQAHLARLEHQLSLLARQFDRAELGIEELKHRANGYEPKEMLHAEQFANRIHQQTVRLLKEIQKTQLLLDKLASEPPQQKSTLPAKALPIKALPAKASSTSIEPPTESDSQDAKEMASVKSEQAPPSIRIEDTPASRQPTEEEFLQCIVKNRDRIRATPAKDRKALMLRLIQEHRDSASHRTKTTSRAA